MIEALALCLAALGVLIALVGALILIYVAR